MNEIINNDVHKLIFLKAILLGINYGKNENYNYYIETINEEIKKIENYKLNKDKINKDKINKNLEKEEIIINNLENQKNYTISLINNLSKKNYSFNHSKINLLKDNLNVINRNIEKYKKKINHNKKSNKNKLIKNNNLVNELEKTLENLSNMFI